MNDADTVTITKEEYESLLKKAKFLQALREAGVNNWEGYSHALDLLNIED